MAATYVFPDGFEFQNIFLLPQHDSLSADWYEDPNPPLGVTTYLDGLFNETKSEYSCLAPAIDLSDEKANTDPAFHTVDTQANQTPHTVNPKALHTLHVEIEDLNEEPADDQISDIISEYLAPSTPAPVDQPTTVNLPPTPTTPPATRSWPIPPTETTAQLGQTPTPARRRSTRKQPTSRKSLPSPPLTPVSPIKRSRRAAIRAIANYSSSDTESDAGSIFSDPPSPAASSDGGNNDPDAPFESAPSKKRSSKGKARYREGRKGPVRDGPARRDQNKRAQCIYRNKKKALAGLDRKFVLKLLSSSSLEELQNLKTQYKRELRVVSLREAEDIDMALDRGPG